MAGFDDVADLISPRLSDVLHTLGDSRPARLFAECILRQRTKHSQRRIFYAPALFLRIFKIGRRMFSFGSAEPESALSSAQVRTIFWERDERVKGP